MLLSCLGTAASLFAQSSALPNPVGWWRFDEGAGVTAADSSGNGYDATLYNGVSWTTGKTGNALSADGSSGYLMTPGIDLSGTQAITWAAWINRTYSSNVVHAMLEDSANYNASTTGFVFFPDGDVASSCPGLAVGIHGDAGYTMSCFAQPSSGVWHHVAIVLDKSQAGTQAISLYIDGQKQTAVGQYYAATNTNGFGDNPLYLFSRGGSQYFTAGTVGDLRLYAQALSADQILQVYQQGVASLVSLAVTPVSSSVVGGTTQQFSALATYRDGSTQDLTASAAWSSSNPPVATVASTGLATAVGAGSAAIQAMAGAVSSSATLTVTAPVLVSLSVTPSSASAAIGGSRQFAATGAFNNGATQNLTASVAWSAANPAIATVDASGMATGIAYGSTAIQASLGSITGSANFTVQSVTLQSIAIAPARSQVAVSAQLQLTATGAYSDGSTQDITNQVAWSADDATVASIASSGLVSGIGLGNTTLRASLNAVNGSTTLTVTPSGLAGWWTFDEGSGTTAADSSGNGYDATLYNGVSWTTGKTGNAVSADGSSGYLTIPAIDLSGTQAITWAAWINRTYSSNVVHAMLEDSANYNASTTGFGFFPDGDASSSCSGLAIGIHGDAGYTTSCFAQPSSGVWHHLAFVLDKSQAGNQAISLYIDGQIQTATGQYYAATNSNGFGNNPLYLFSRDGSQYFTAGSVDDLRLYRHALSLGEIGTLYGLGATNATLVSLAVSPASSSIVGSTTQQFSAVGTYSDGSTQDLTASVAWSSSNASVAAIASTGLATAIGAGSATIQAASGAVSGSAALTVTAPVLVSLSVTPSTASTTIAGIQQFAVTGAYNNGASQNLTASVAWNVANPAIASVNAAGMVTGIAYGSTAIQASLGSIAGSANLTVQSASLQSIAVTPVNSQVAVSAQLQLTATGTYSDGSRQDITNQVVWSTDDTTVASIASSGLVTGIGLGNTALRASLNTVNGSTTLTVTPSGLVGWWTFDEGSGVTAADSSGNGYDATLYNGVNWTTGQTGGAISANGANQYIATPSINLSSTQAFSLAAWVSRAWLNSGFKVMIEAGANYNSTSSGFAFFVDDSSDCGIPSAILTGVHGNGGYALNCYAPPASGGWHHLAVVCDKSRPGNQQVNLYIDGIAQIPVASPYATTNSNTFGNQPFYFFSRSGVQYFSAGMVSDLRLYNRALAAAEIEAIYGLGATSAVLQSLAVTPVDSAIVSGNTEQFTATGTYSDGSTRNLTSSVTWASSNSAVASIAGNGLATGIAAGSTVVQATSGSIAASDNLTVVSAPPRSVQFIQWTAGDGGANTQETTHLPNIVTTGNLILVFAHWDNQAVTATVSDQAGNTYLPIFAVTNSGPSDRFQVWYAKNVTGGVALAITISFSGTTNSYSVLDAMEYAGLDQTSPLDQFASATGSGIAQSSGSIVVPNANSETVIGMFGYAGYALPYTAGAGFTMRGYDASTLVEDRSAVLAGTYTATATSENPPNWAAFVMSFKNAAQ